MTESARVVVGADGKRSLVARAVGASAYREQPVLSMGFYTYWEGVELSGGEMYARPRRMVGAWPTNDGLVMTYVAWPVEEFAAFRADVERNFLDTLDSAGDLGERVRAGRRAERFRGSPDLPNVFRVPHGPGWVLAGDAGLTMDPITGQGIGHAFRDAELIADALAAGLGGSRPLNEALEEYRRVRDEETVPMYEFTTELASFRPPGVEQQVLLEAIADKPSEVSRFFGVLTGTVPMREYFSSRNVFRLIGLRGMAKVMSGRRRARSAA